MLSFNYRVEALHTAAEEEFLDIGDRKHHQIRKIPWDIRPKK